MNTIPKRPVQEHFDTHAANYDGRWKLYLENTQQEVLQYVHLKPGEQLLDVGCGTGLLLKRLAKRYPNCELFGVELTPNMFSIAQQRLKDSAVKLFFGEAERLPFLKERFDVVVCSSVLHYVDDPQAALQEMFRVLKSHGHLVLLDWNRDTLAAKLREHFYFRQFFKSHVKTYTLLELKDMLQKAGFSIVSEKRWQHKQWSLMLVKAEKA